MDLPASLLKEVINHMPEGVIIMDEERVIHYMNESAADLTGWKVGGEVPYCSYCQQREVPEGENRCLLTAEDPVPFFHSHMAVYSGIEEVFEMSLKKIKYREKQYFVLRMRRPIEIDNEKAKFHELLVQETMIAQEAERRRIARELHDHIGQSVYSIFLGLEGIRGYVDNPKFESHILNMVNVMERTLSDIKRLSKNLRPEIVYHLGLKEALEEAVLDWEKFYQVGLTLELEVQPAAFNKEKELHLFRVIQEGVRNAVLHGKATRIQIQVKSTGQYIFFQIIDNGIGFDVDTRKKKGLGLKHMYERCLMMDGDIRWTSKKDGPTRVEGFVSILEKEGETCYESADC